MLKRFWLFVSNYAERPFMTPDEHRQNRLLNHGFFYAICLYFFTYFVALTYFFFLCKIDCATYSRYFFPFTITSMGCAALAIALFWSRRFSALATLASTGSVIVGALHLFVMLLFLGPASGFHFFLAAIMPVAYLAHPRRRLIYIPLYIAISFSIGFGLLHTSVAGPIYPIPEPFLSITFYLVVTVAILFFFMSLGYAAYRYDWLRQGRIYWDAISAFGLQWAGTEEARTHHIITNQTMALHAIFPPVIILTALALSLLLLWQGVAGWWKHLLAFCGAALVAGSLWLILFLQAARRWRAGFLYLFMVVDLLLVTYMVVMTGGQFGIQYFYFALIPLPIYFFPGKRRLFTAEALILTLGLLAAVFAGQLRPVLDVPDWMVRPVHLIVVTLIIASVCLGLTYIWWQRQLTRRVFLWWEKLSSLGVSANQPRRTAKKQIIINRLAFIALGYALIVYPFAHAMNTLALWQNHYEKLVISTILYSLPILFALVGLGLFLVLRLRYSHNFHEGTPLYNAWPTVFCIFLWVFLLIPSLLFQNAAYIHMFLIVPAIIGFLLYNLLHVPRWNLIAIGLSILAPVAVTVFHRTHGPLMPVPDYIESRTMYFVLVAFPCAIISMIYYLILESDKAESAIEMAHQKSESLLLNILPRDVADELKDKGHSAPVRIESVTVMFTDFAGFTKISEALSPEQVVDELDKCFSYFDQIMEKYNLEKLKTIGDSYMCAGGIPRPNYTHAIDCCLAAMEIQSFMNQMKDIKAMQGLPYWELRLGIHTGPLVAGVVGNKKFAYDVWGDTVNTASRMESSGTTGKINISWATYEAVKFLFDCEHRGQVAAKNKGMIDMYYLNGLRHKFSVGGEGRGRVPNARFKEIYAAIARGARLMPK